MDNVHKLDSHLALEFWLNNDPVNLLLVDLQTSERCKFSLATVHVAVVSHCMQKRRDCFNQSHFLSYFHT